MPPRKKEPICEIIFRGLRLPVSDQERGKQVIEGIFMIGQIGEGEAKPRGRKRGRRRAKAAKVGARGKRKGRVQRVKRAAGRREKSRKPAEAAKKPVINPVSVG